MGALDSLEQAQGGPFTFILDGVRYTMPDPVALGYRAILHALRYLGDGIIPWPMPLWKRELLLRRWTAHYDLPTYRQANRLAFLIDRYHDAIEYDLQTFAAGANLGEMWRRREWRRLLNLIDHLPRWSYYSTAVANDDDHAEALAKAQANAPKAEEAEDPGLPQTLFTPEVGALADLVDAVNRLDFHLVAINSDKGKGPKTPKPYPRPRTALDRARKRAEAQRRLRVHQSLVERMLPHKRQNGATPGD